MKREVKFCDICGISFEQSSNIKIVTTDDFEHLPLADQIISEIGSAVANDICDVCEKKIISYIRSIKK